MKVGRIIHLMDGYGSTYKAAITDANHRRCGFSIVEQFDHEKPSPLTHVAIAPTKNMDRLEWFVEKACELGVHEISLIQTQRAERSKVNLERLEKKAIGAMKQSKNFWKCKINELTSFNNFLAGVESSWSKYIAFVETKSSESLARLADTQTNTIILIGPEGDFTVKEVESAKNQGFTPVNLGKSVLRTETAGIIAVHTMNVLRETSGLIKTS